MHVNLLKKSEMRYQGAVTKKFMIVAPIATILLLIAVFTPIQLMIMANNRSKYRQLADELEQLKTVVERVNRLSTLCADNQKVLDAVAERTTYTLNTHLLLRGIQKSVPEEVQFVALSYITSPQLDQDNADPNNPAWPISLRVHGLAQAEQPESIIIPYVNSFSKDEEFSRQFSSVNLVEYDRLLQPLNAKQDRKMESAKFQILAKGLLCQPESS